MSKKMNIFRLAGDMTHLMSIIVLLLKIHSIKSCAGTEILALYSADRSSQCIPALWEIVLSLCFSILRFSETYSWSELLLRLLQHVFLLASAVESLFLCQQSLFFPADCCHRALVSGSLFSGIITLVVVVVLLLLLMVVMSEIRDLTEDTRALCHCICNTLS